MAVGFVLTLDHRQHERVVGEGLEAVDLHRWHHEHDVAVFQYPVVDDVQVGMAVAVTVVGALVDRMAQVPTCR